MISLLADYNNMVILKICYWAGNWIPALYKYIIIIIII